MKKILLVDDEDFFRERLDRAFVRRGYTTSTASCYEEAMAITRKEKPTMAVVDLKMPGKSGLLLIKDALAIVPTLMIVVLTAVITAGTTSAADSRMTANRRRGPPGD